MNFGNFQIQLELQRLNKRVIVGRVNCRKPVLCLPPLHMSSREHDAFSTHYGVLRDYLASYIAQGSGRGRVFGRDKLNRLPPDQFFDVSTDLTDEINRRIQNSPDSNLN